MFVFVLLATGYFHDKTKIAQANLRVDHYLLLNCKRQCTLFTLSTPNHLQNLTPKC